MLGLFIVDGLLAVSDLGVLVESERKETAIHMTCLGLGIDSRHGMESRPCWIEGRMTNYGTFLLWIAAF